MLLRLKVLKQKLIRQAIELYYAEMRIILDEKRMLLEREERCFDRFIDRCNDIHEETFFERVGNMVSGLISREPEDV